MHSSVLNSTSFLSRKAILPLVRGWKQAGHTIGFTSGAFDLLHPGHVDYLARAAKKCDRLIVAVNSDASIRSYKDPRRPVVPERDRLRVVAGLGSVDVAFLFRETNNRENILAIKPDLYIKGADYAASKAGAKKSEKKSEKSSELTSAPLLKEWGGRVVTIPLVKGKSTSSLIDRVLSRYHDELPRVLPVKPISPKSRTKKTPAVFLDRDGVINQEVEYLHEPKKFKLIPGVLQALQLFREHGYKIIVVTNQAGIGLGYFSKTEFFQVNKKMLSLFHTAGVVADKVYYCPHGVGMGCRCRKPGTLMIEQAVVDENIDLKKSLLIGDSLHDIICGNKMGLATVLVRTGHGKKAEQQIAQHREEKGNRGIKKNNFIPDRVEDDALQATRWFLFDTKLKSAKQKK